MNIHSVSLPLISAFGLFGNVSFLYVAYHGDGMRTITNLYLVNLAIADACLLICARYCAISMELLAVVGNRFSGWLFRAGCGDLPLLFRLSVSHRLRYGFEFRWRLRRSNLY